jgi:hypothetical protein
MIDAEHSEQSVMSGLRQTLSNPKCRAVLAEVHPILLPEGTTGNDILKILASRGFKKIDTLRWSVSTEFYAISERAAS